MGDWSIRARWRKRIGAGALAALLLWPASQAVAAVSVSREFGSAYDARRGGLEIAADPIYQQPPRTAECWVRIDTPKPPNIIVAQSIKQSSEHWELFTQGGSGMLGTFMPGYAPDHVLSTAAVADGKWHYVAMTFDGRRVCLWVDGKQVADAAVERRRAAGETGPLWIGAYPPQELVCAGLIDEVRLSNLIRPIGSVPTEPFTVDDQTVGLWRFEERGRRFADESRRQAIAGRVVNAGKPKDHSTVWDEKNGVDDRWQATDLGRFFSGTIRSPGQVTAKGLAIRLGDQGQAAVLYDTERLRTASGWLGDFVRIHPARFGLTDMPLIGGREQFSSPALTGWGAAGSFEASGAKAPAPGWAHYRGLYPHENRVVLSLSVGGVSVLESPWLETQGPVSAFTRTLEIGPHAEPWEMLVAREPNGQVQVDPLPPATIVWLATDSGALGVGLVGEGASLAVGPEGRVTLRIAAADAERRFKLFVAKVAAADRPALAQLIAGSAPPQNLTALTAPSAPHWAETVVTEGVVSDQAGAYVVDTLTLPDDNPYRALLFTSGHDFFSSGEAAVATVHGDVWLCRGIDASLHELRWRRFASGLYQPLGLKIVGDLVHVIGRDQITRLADRNADGEADWYENFNNDSPTLPGHDFSTCLETDRAGNFYFLHAREGVMQVSPDGRSVRSIAMGLRNPNGLGVGPDDTITVSPQEGTWTGASSIIRVKEDGYYGYFGPRITPARPLGYDPPWCWLPRALDNSSGGQAWATDQRFGPLAGHMFHLSYGRSQMLLAMEDRVGDVSQGTVTPLPLRFESGIMRGRVRPQDGQLYLSGLKGWETNAARDGCFQRVRYTGGVVYLPLEVKYHEDGIAITFACPLDKSAAEDVENYAAQVWAYRYSEAYGSPDYKISVPGEEGRDELKINAATLAPDGRTVFLSVDKLTPVMQIGIDFTIDAADGVALNSGVYGTIHALHPAHDDPATLVRAAPNRSRLPADVEARLQPGLVFRFRSGADQAASAGGDRKEDVCVRRLAALHVEPGRAPIAWLPARPFQLVAEGFLKVPLRGLYRFRFNGAGQASLSIGGQQIIAGSGDDLSTAASAPIRLAKGYNRLRIEYSSRADAAASFQLCWSADSFAWEPIPPTALFSDSGSAGLAEANLLRRGRELFADRMCSRCHRLPEGEQNQPPALAAGPGLAMAELSKDAPALDALAARLRPDWLSAWIADPRSLSAEATMPRLFATDSPADRQAVADIVAYLQASGPGQPADPKSPAADEEAIDAGEMHFERLGCIACHTLARSRDSEPDGRSSLALVAAKFAPGALEDYLRRPHARYPWSRMPDDHLTAEEAAQLGAFLEARAEGKIEPMPALPAGDAVRGQKAFAERGCRQCHIDPAMPARPPREKSLFVLPDERSGCLAAAAGQRRGAPDFGLADDDRGALAALLAGDGRSLLADTPVEASTRLLKSFRCAACHTIDARPSLLPKIVAEDGVTGLIPDNIPPLTFAGEKLKAEWMSAFLAGHVADRPRPWLAIRMPSFPAAATLLAEGLAAEHGVGPQNESVAPDAALAEIGLALTQTRGGLDCRQCHGLERLTVRQPNDGQGISFLHVAQRIRHPYYRRWMLDPLRIEPGTKMPRLSPDGQHTAVRNILEGSADRQFEALWNYLQKVGQPLE